MLFRSGQGLILPKQNLHVQHIGPDEDRKQITKDLLSKKYGTFGVAGGTHYTDTPGFDGVIDEIAAELGVTSALHANTGPYHLESENNYNTDGPVEHAIRNNADPVGYFIPSWIADFSDNAILRLADRKSGKWSGASSNTVYKNESGRRGFVSTSRRVGAPDGPKDISKGIKDFDTARTVGAVQSRVNEIVSGVDFSKRNIGFASRGDVIPVKNKTIDEIAKELELTDEEKDILASMFPSQDDLKAMTFSPSFTREERERIINSVKVRVGDDGVPFITAEPHPGIRAIIPGDRDYSSIMVPKEERRKEIRDLLEEIGEKVDIGDRATIDAADERVRGIFKDFGNWAMSQYDEVAKRYPTEEYPNHGGGAVYSEGGNPTMLTIWSGAMARMGEENIREFYGENNFLNAHDLIGHVGTGRGFDRHGEWANMMAMFALMDKWAEQEGIGEGDLLRLKAHWFSSLEYARFVDGRFTRPRDEKSPVSNREWFERERGIWDAISSGMASNEDLRKFISLLDDGNVHTGDSTPLSDATPEQLSSIATHDVVSTSLKAEHAANERRGFASRSGDWKTNTHGVETEIGRAHV